MFFCNWYHFVSSDPNPFLGWWQIRNHLIVFGQIRIRIWNTKSGYGCQICYIYTARTEYYSTVPQHSLIRYRAEKRRYKGALQGITYIYIYIYFLWILSTSFFLLLTMKYLMTVRFSNLSFWYYFSYFELKKYILSVFTHFSRETSNNDQIVIDQIL